MANFLKPVRRNAGLGDPPEPYLNNLPESGNAVIRRAVNYQPNEMSHFFMEMEELITQQKQDCEAAILNRGSYMLSEEFKSLQIPPEKWFKMNTNQREVALQKLWKTHLPSLNQDDDLPAGDQEYLELDQSQQSCPLSVDPETSGLAGIPLLLLKDMYTQASNLLGSKGAIVQAPSQQEHSFVVRNDSGGRPYHVFQQSNGKVVCEQCERYESAKICCHSSAVAEKCGALDKFLTWYRRSPQTITATGYVTSDSSKTVGRKAGKERPSTV